VEDTDPHQKNGNPYDEQNEGQIASK
jgi:hypothetical protein